MLIFLYATSTMMLVVVPKVAYSDYVIPKAITISSTDQELDGGSSYESCPTCNGGYRVHHHHIVYVRCAEIDKEAYENGEIKNPSEGKHNEAALMPAGSSSLTGSHYHHKHYFCVR